MSTMLLSIKPKYVKVILEGKKNGGNSKSAMQVEPEYDDDNEITEDEDDMKFYDDQDDEI